ncbi:hypothetical protein [Gluconacetobacter tumulisoli]|uniref:Terminase n=1 Tax=Gluconacetobacter tumulisoli TaxID=1286189 RepID=A0A7W4K5M5_9PROT|nr:hypothetical protein [Gluconacetobacter tumulisoli]MBB2200718.1 hypothetical protein [Gluconacetobacter tumulisoli]
MTALSYNRDAVPTVRAFMASDAFVRGLMGPFGSGKSSGCVWEIILRGLRQAPGPDGVRRSRWAVIRNSYRQLEDTTIRTVHQWFPPARFGRWKPTDHSYVIDRMRNEGDDAPVEIEFLFRALDRPDQVGNLLSLELTGAWINEAREVPWAIVEAVQGRVGRYPARRDGGATWSGLIMDTNPPDAESDWFRFFEEQDHSAAIAALAAGLPGMTADGFARLFRQPGGLSAGAENLENLPPAYYQRLAVGKSDEWVKVYIDGDYGFVMDGRPVFAEYADGFHCAECRTVPDLPIYRGWDFGLTPACVWSQVLPSGQWIVVDELVSSSMGIDRFSDEVMQHSARHYPRSVFIDVGDPAGTQRAQTDERTCFEILHAKGIAIEPGQQGLAIRLESVRRPLRTLVDGAQPGFLLHPRCRMLRRALMGGYRYRRMQVGGERHADRPEKNRWSHVTDALQYVATRLFGPSLRFAEAGAGDGDKDFNAHPADDRTRSSVTGY